MKNILVVFLVGILGAVMAAVIDRALGINFANVSRAVVVTHTVTHLAWGAALAVAVGRAMK